MSIQQSAQYKELNMFLSKYVKNAVSTNFSVESINHGINYQGDNVLSAEANTDIQYAIAMAQNIDVRYYPVGGEFHGFIPDLEYMPPRLKSCQV